MELSVYKNMDKAIDVIKKYFNNDYKLYCVSEVEIEKFRGLYDSDVIHLFNNKTWIDIWNDPTCIKLSERIENNYPSLFALLDYYYYEHNNIIPPEEDERLKDFVFYFTGLFYLLAIEGMANNVGSFVIIEFLDPKDCSEEYYYSNPKIKKIFPSLIERYTSEQLFLISVLFLSLPEYVSRSKFGIKYWTWIYENTDDDIRKTIIKQFEEGS